MREPIPSANGTELRPAPAAPELRERPEAGEPRPAVEPLLLTPREAAEALRMSESWLWQRTAAGEIKALKLGRSVRYRMADLERYIAGRAGEGNAP